MTIGRSAKTGKFMPVAQARRHPSTTTVEKVARPPKKGKGK
jgi:hypothetical protein